MFSLAALPMDTPVALALASMLVAFSMSLYGLLRNVAPVKGRTKERSHD